MPIKVKGQWVNWGDISLKEIKAQISCGCLLTTDLQRLLKQHVFSNEVTGFLYKYLYPKLNEFGRVVKNKFTF